jgi:hypothetical protein
MGEEGGAIGRSAGFPTCCVAALPSRQGVLGFARAKTSTPRKFGNLRYGRLGSLRYEGRRAPFRQNTFHFTSVPQSSMAAP